MIQTVLSDLKINFVKHKSKKQILKRLHAYGYNFLLEILVIGLLGEKFDVFFKRKTLIEEGRGGNRGKRENSGCT